MLANQQRLKRDLSKQEQLVERQQYLETLKKRQVEKYQSTQQKLLLQFHSHLENKLPQQAPLSTTLLRSAKPSLEAQLDEQLRAATEKRLAGAPTVAATYTAEAGTQDKQQTQAMPPAPKRADEMAMGYLLQLQQKHEQQESLEEQKQEEKQLLHRQHEEAEALRQNMLQKEAAAAAAAAVAHKQEALRAEALQQEELAQQEALQQQQAEESKQARLQLEASEFNAWQHQALQKEDTQAWETEKKWQAEVQAREAMLEEQAYNRKRFEEQQLQATGWATPSAEQHWQVWQQEAQQAEVFGQHHEHQQPWPDYTWEDPVPTTTYLQDEEVEALQRQLEQQKLEENKQREELALFEEKVAQQRATMLEAEQQLAELQQASKKPRLDETPKFLAPTSKAGGCPPNLQSCGPPSSSSGTAASKAPTTQASRASTSSRASTFAFPCGSC